MPRIRKEWTTLSVTKGLLYRLQFLKSRNPKQPYHVFISSVLDEYDILYEQNKALRRRLYMAEPSLEQQLEHQCPALRQPEQVVSQ